MLYITTKRYNDFKSINNVWDIYGYSNKSEIEQAYRKFILDKSIVLNIIINEHWLNIMNYENHHKDIYTVDEYKLKVKDWNKFLNQWNIDKFISEILKGTKMIFSESTF